MKKYVLKYGFIAGGMMSAMMLATVPFMHKFGMEVGLVIGYSSMILAFLMIYFGVRAYRDAVLNGVIGFGAAFKAGLLITLLSSACYVATWEVVYFGGFAPNIMEDYVAQAIAKSRTSGKPQAAIDAEIKEMEQMQINYRKPLYNMAYTFIEPLPVGLLLTLLSAGLLSRKRRPATAAGGLASQT
ncbi:MAG: DUF4199 domain-containing protein [Phycisphaerae bacterium]|nr:DUF4199 domain-containing protein [Gemmatimonadaceae bacterium]